MRAHGDYLLHLFLAATSKEDLSPKQAANLDLIRRSTGGDPMIDMTRCFLHGPWVPLARLRRESNFRYVRITRGFPGLAAVRK